MTSLLSIPETDVEPLAKVLGTLRLQHLDGKRCRGESLPQMSKRIYGGQVLAQATMMAADTLPADNDRLAHFITAIFLCPGRIDQPLFFEVTELDDSRSFSTRNVNTLQDDHIIFTARISAQFHQPGPSFGEEQSDAPVPKTLESPVDFFVAMNIPWGHIVSATNSLDMRHVGGFIFTAPAKERMNRHLIWFKSRLAMPKGSSKLLQRAMLGYTADQSMLEPVMRATGIYWTRPEVSMVTLDHSIWWHRNFGLSDWILAELISPSVQNGRGLTIAKFFQGGKHIATMFQGGVTRPRDVTHTEE